MLFETLVLARLPVCQTTEGGLQPPMVRLALAARASLMLVATAACKALPIDLSGVPRALAFVGLGGALVGIGIAYQRLAPEAA